MNSSKACLTLVNGYRASTVILSLLILLAVAAVSVRSQGQITALEKNLRRADPTTEVVCIRYRTTDGTTTKKAEPKVAISMALGIGDELISNRGTVTVKARCGTATDLILSGPFRVRFLKSSNQGCSIYSYPKPGGRINVSSSAPTNVQSGEVILATRRTAYEVKTKKITQRIRVKTRKGTRIRVSTSIQQEVIAYEDRVEATVGGRQVIEVKQGEKLVTTGGDVKPTNISVQDTERTADDKARIDVSELPRSYTKAERVKAFSRLKELHKNVLTHLAEASVPRDTKPVEDIKPPKDTSPIDDKPPATTKAAADTGPSVVTKRSGKIKPYRGVQMSPTAWTVGLWANTETVLPLTVGNLCKETHTIVVELRDLSFARFLSNAESVIAGRSSTVAKVQFGKTKPGFYRGRVVASCRDCVPQDVCIRGVLQVNITVTDEQPDVTTPVKPNEYKEPTESGKPPDQASLFELLSLG